MSYIGFDIGNSYIRISVFRNDGVDIIPDESGNRKIPAYIAFTETERFIGESAKNQATMNPKNTVFDILRLIGRRFSDPLFQNDLKLWPFEVVPGIDDRPQVKVEWKNHTKQYYPEELLGMILLRIKKVAGKQINQEITDAVFSIPCCFNLHQIESLRCAAALAGIRAIRFISAPTLVAITFGYNHSSNKERHVLVFDYGSSFLNISLLDIDGGMYEVKATTCHPNFGGEDIDFKLINYFADRFQQKYQKDIRQSPRSFMLLRRVCERAKQALTVSPTTTVTCDSIIDGIDLADNITREEFEKLNEELFQYVLNPIKQALKDANLTKNEITDIVLFGGSSRIRKVNQIISEFFDGKELSKGVDRDEAASFGAAIQAAIIHGCIDQSIKDIMLIDIKSNSFGYKDKNGKINILIPRNTCIPARKYQSITDLDIDQNGMISISIYEGESTLATNGIFLNRITFGPVSENDSKIEVYFDINADGNLKVSISDNKENKVEKYISLKFEPFDGSMEGKIAELELYENDDEEINKTSETRNRLEGFCLNVLDSLPAIQQEMNDILNWIELNKNADISEFEAKIKHIEDRFDSLKPKT